MTDPPETLGRLPWLMMRRTVLVAACAHAYLDVVGQAVSWARVEQSACWQHGDEVRAEPRLDIDQVDRLVGTICDHNAAWRTWFATEAVEPLDVAYESLVACPDETVKSILDLIRVQPPPDWTPESPHERQAHAINADWVRATAHHAGEAPPQERPILPRSMRGLTALGAHSVSRTACGTRSGRKTASVAHVTGDRLAGRQRPRGRAPRPCSRERWTRETVCA